MLDGPVSYICILFTLTLALTQPHNQLLLSQQLLWLCAPNVRE